MTLNRLTSSLSPLIYRFPPIPLSKMPALTRAAAKRGETAPPPPPARVIETPVVPQTPSTVIADTPTPRAPIARVPRTRKLTREDTIVEISVSQTGQGTHIRWIRPGITSNSPDHDEVVVVDLDDKRPPGIVNAYSVPLPVVDDPFATPAPQPQLTTPPRIQRNSWGSGRGALPPARRILHASGESFYQIILPSKDVQDILTHANANSVDLYSAFRPFTAGAEDEDGNYNSGGGFDFTPVPSTARRVGLGLSESESLGSPFQSQGNQAQARVFGCYPPVADASPLAQAGVSRMGTRSTPLRAKHL